MFRGVVPEMCVFPCACDYLLQLQIRYIHHLDDASKTLLIDSLSDIQDSEQHFYLESSNARFPQLVHCPMADLGDEDCSRDSICFLVTTAYCQPLPFKTACIPYCLPQPSLREDIGYMIPITTLPRPQFIYFYWVFLFPFIHLTRALKNMYHYCGAPLNGRKTASKTITNQGYHALSQRRLLLLQDLYSFSELFYLLSS